MGVIFEWRIYKYLCEMYVFSVLNLFSLSSESPFAIIPLKRFIGVVFVK